MSRKKVVILDGCGPTDRDLNPILDVLVDGLKRARFQVETLRLCEMKLAHCLGCFGCWVKTPGLCVEDDAGREVTRAVSQSDITVFYTPVTFGGYSPDLKKIVDHLLPLLSPYFQIEHGEVHHPPRYARRPRLMMVGVQRHPNSREARIFKALAGRNAVNFHPPTYAAEVVCADDPAETLRRRFETLLARSDDLPFGDSGASLMPPLDSGVSADTDSSKTALLIVGSPKTNSSSASRALGSYLLESLGTHGWGTELFTLRANLNRTEGEAALLAAVDRAGLILLVFPLYVDALPYLVTKGLVAIAAHRRAAANSLRQRLVAIVNSGFPETHQNAVALAICQEFAVQSGIGWGGALALGGGGAIGGQPLAMKKRSGPPVKQIIRALDLAAADLAEGRPVPAEATKLMEKNPIPFMPFALWRWIYMHSWHKGFEQQAARNGVTRDSLFDKPYAA